MSQTPESSPSPQVPDSLFARARAGDEAAWAELVRTCYPKVQRVVSKKLAPRLRSLYDSTDFANEVFNSLAIKSDKFDFPSLDALLSFLYQAAERKVNDGYRRHLAQKRQIDRDRHLGVEEEAGSPDLASHDPTPSKIAEANERREQLMQLKGDLRELIRLKEQRYSNAEIAEATGWNIRTVQRLLKQLGESLGLR